MVCFKVQCTLCFLPFWICLEAPDVPCLTPLPLILFRWLFSASFCERWTTWRPLKLFKNRTGTTSHTQPCRPNALFLSPLTSSSVPTVTMPWTRSMTTSGTSPSWSTSPVSFLNCPISYAVDLTFLRGPFFPFSLTVCWDIHHKRGETEKRQIAVRSSNLSWLHQVYSNTRLYI